MAMASLVTNVSQLFMHFSTEMWNNEADGITDEVFVIGGYSKWKNRSIDKQGIEYYNLFTSAAQLGTTGLCYWTN